MRNNICKKIYLIRALYPGYIKNYYNTKIKTNNPISKQAKVWIGISPKKIHKWPISTWEGIIHNGSSGKCRSKPRWHVISHPLSWLLLKTKQSIKQTNIRKENSCFQGLGGGRKHGDRGSVWGDEKVPGMGGGEGCTIMWMYVMPQNGSS